MNGFVLILLIIAGAIIYLIPSFLGYRKKNFAGILLLNIFLGWTFLGWLAALIWATTKD